MAQPTALEQEMLELMNRFRLNPAAELSLLLNSSDADVKNALAYFNVRLTELTNQWSSLVAAQPLAWSSLLNEAAAGHNQFMINQDQQSHQLPGEPSLGDRVNNVGYTNWTGLAENVFAYGKSVFHGYAAFAINWGLTSTGIQNPAAHRGNMINNNFREVGLSITPENNPATSVGSLVVTQNFANNNTLTNKGYLLGVAFRDFDRDNFYDAGEGLGDVQINVTRLNSTPFRQNLGTMNAGGYQTLLDPGQYLVRFFRNGSLVRSQTTTINATNTSNVKLDLQLDVGTAPNAGLGKIVGTLFNDLNGNGVWNQWEPVLSGWQVFLDSNGNKKLDSGETSVVTDANGEYSFNNLAPGTYNVAELLPSGWQQTAPNTNSPIGLETYKLDDGVLDGAITYTSGDTMIFNAFTAKSATETLNSITVGLSSYGNPRALFLYRDLNGNNTPDSNEKVLELATNFTGNTGFANLAITPTTVSGTFFVAALYRGNGSNSTWIPRDTNNPSGKSWLAFSAANSFNSANFSAVNVTGTNWLLRANTSGPLSQAITLSANQTLAQVNFGNQNVNNNQPHIFINNVLATEGNSGSSNAIFTVNLSRASSQVVTVNYATANQTASAGSDYSRTTGTLTFNPGETQKTINVAVLGDTASEADENFLVNLANPTNGMIGDSQGVGTILSDDIATISIQNLTVVEGRDNQAVVNVTLNAPSTQAVSVTYTTSAGTATTNTDFTPITGTLTFNPGQTQRTLNIPIVNDALNEADETFTVTLASPSNTLLGTSTATVTITDTLQSSATAILPSNVENLTLTGTTAINGTGNAGHNRITGNSGNNILTGLDGNDIFTGGGGKDTLTGGLGQDRFNYQTLTHSLLNNFDRITDFNANAGQDLFQLSTQRSGFINVGAVATLDNAGITAKLTTTNFGTNFAAQFTFGSRTFVAINDGIAGFNATTDGIVEVTGFTGTININDFI
ncbi:SCP-like extracellular protein, putative [Richelia sinica FACHB-800]|uniref:SCP-like extracellular protein, putative n=1 Tax=Richelia sinica FACHB-800 TaxID=1357546 RepID=A0A975TCT7_9NOST|nr:Calx-beta domain-containing protein [Richelia sinica]MBD2663840.1 hypothetical protein [Richelia sinica FACHB-800]QXE26451.1 SCP-like extracellular protein, putative [Richelia sinica FACHB-800]